MNNQNTTKAASLPTPKQKELSDTSSSSPVIVPTPSIISDPDDLALRDESKMESSQDKTELQVLEETEKLEEQQEIVPTQPIDNVKTVAVVDKEKKRGAQKSKKSLKKYNRKVEESSESESSDSDTDSESESSSSEDEKAARRLKQKLAAKRAAAKKRQKVKAKSKSKRSKSKKYDSTSDETSSDESSDDNSESEVENKKNRQKARKLKAKKKSRKLAESSDGSDSDSSSSVSSSENERAKRKRSKAKSKRKAKKSKKVDNSSSSSSNASSDDDAPVLLADSLVEATTTGAELDTQVAQVSGILANLKLQQSAASTTATATKLDKPVKKNALEFKRVDQVYDMKIRDWKLVESNLDAKDEFDCVFTVRRRLNWEGKYQETQVDIKSKVLRNCLQEVFKECKSISLVEDTPQVDPHTLFHYYSEIKTYVRKELKPKLKSARKSKEKKLRTQQVAQCKLLLKYLDEDYTTIRKALKPMLKAGTITYDLVWALFKPNTIAFAPTYSNKDDPRCFRVDVSYEYESWLTQAKSLVVDGKYLEYDGKAFGLGDHQVQIQAFKGHKKITSLSAYPLKYHKDPEVSNVILPSWTAQLTTCRAFANSSSSEG
jgi:hypothetical protein